MKKITPNQFKEAFLKVVESELYKPKLVAFWDEGKKYTPFMIENVFPAIAGELGISVYPGNYYYLDSVFYSERDTEHFGATTTYAKSISIAMEHENKIEGTAIEMNKLQLYNAPLKVLITYAQNPTIRKNWLNCYTKIVQGADVFGDFATLRRQLIIFGSITDDVITWCFYAYESSGFQEI